jgi:hypothetical protein
VTRPDLDAALGGTQTRRQRSTDGSSPPTTLTALLRRDSLGSSRTSAPSSPNRAAHAPTDTADPVVEAVQRIRADRDALLALLTQREGE